MAKLDIPESWAECKLEDIAKVEWGNTSVTKEKYTSSGFPAFSASGHDGFLPFADWSGDAVILSAIGARCGKCFLANGSWTAIKNTIVIQATSEQLSNKFIWYYLNEPSRWNISGTAQPFITMKTANSISFPHPPLAEQKRIVAKIESTTAKIDAIEKAVTEAETLLEKYRESLLAKAFRGELVPQDPNDEPASKLLERIRAERAKQQTGKGKKANELPPISEDEIPFEIPKSWEWVRANELCLLITKGTTPQASDMNNVRGDVPFLKVYNLTFDGEIDYTKNLTFVSKKVHSEQLSRSRVQHGDVLMNIVGPPLGKIGIVRDTFEEHNINQAIALFRPSLTLDQEYLSHLFFFRSSRETLNLKNQKRHLGS